MSVINLAGAVAAEVKRRLETITLALGAETDVGRKVYQGKRTIDKTLLPCCTMIEGDDVPARQNARTDYQVTQHFAVLAYLECDPDAPNAAAHAAIRSIKRALWTTDGKPDYRWGETVKTVEYLGKQIGPRADGEKFVLAIVEFSVDFVENIATP